MSANTSPAVTGFRWIVFALAFGYWCYEFTVFSRELFGWQFRFLTIWGLTANAIVAFLMLRYSLGRSERTYNPLVTATVILGAIVVFMYWKLYLTDPALVNSGSEVVWYQEYYLHGLGPALMIFDALFILGVFRRIAASIAIMITIFVGYIFWIELLVGPRNTYPEGSVTAGMPYPFLNDMELAQRINFYGVTIGTAIVFFIVGLLLSRAIARLQGRAVTA